MNGTAAREYVRVKSQAEVLGGSGVAKLLHYYAGGVNLLPVGVASTNVSDSHERTGTLILSRH
jgi:hypothetical protein